MCERRMGIARETLKVLLVELLILVKGWGVSPTSPPVTMTTRNPRPFLSLSNIIIDIGGEMEESEMVCRAMLLQYFL